MKIYPMQAVSFVANCDQTAADSNMLSQASQGSGRATLFASLTVFL